MGEKLRIKRIPGAVLGTFAYRLLIKAGATRIEFGDAAEPCCCVEHCKCGCCLPDGTCEDISRHECAARFGISTPACTACSGFPDPCEFDLPECSLCDNDPTFILVRMNFDWAHCPKTNCSSSGNPDLCECENNVGEKLRDRLNALNFVLPIQLNPALPCRWEATVCQFTLAAVEGETECSITFNVAAFVQLSSASGDLRAQIQFVVSAISGNTFLFTSRNYSAGTPPFQVVLIEDYGGNCDTGATGVDVSMSGTTACSGSETAQTVVNESPTINVLIEA